MRAGLTTLAICAATPALATLSDAVSPEAYTGLCTMTRICTADAGCAAIPSMGELLIVVDAGEAALGRDAEDLSPITIYPALDDAFPLPDLDARRRSFLVHLPPRDRARLFAMYVQIADPDSDFTALRPRHFILECLEVPA